MKRTVPQFHSEKVRELKETERGQKAVCKIMEKYEIAAKEEGREEGREGAQISNIRMMMKNLKLSVEAAMNTLGKSCYCSAFP